MTSLMLINCFQLNYNMETLVKRLLRHLILLRMKKNDNEYVCLVIEKWANLCLFIMLFMVSLESFLALFKSP